MTNNESYQKGLKEGMKQAMEILKEAYGAPNMLKTSVGMKFARQLEEFSNQSTNGTSWKVSYVKLPDETSNDKSRYYDVKIILKLDIEKIKQAIVNPEGYEDEYDDDFQGQHEDEAKVAKFSRYDNLALIITMGNGTDYMTTPSVILALEQRDGALKKLVVESIHYVTEETFNDVVVSLVEEFIIGDSEGSLEIPEEAAEKYGLLLHRV